MFKHSTIILAITRIVMAVITAYTAATSGSTTHVIAGLCALLALYVLEVVISVMSDRAGDSYKALFEKERARRDNYEQELQAWQKDNENWKAEYKK